MNKELGKTYDGATASITDHIYLVLVQFPAFFTKGGEGSRFGLRREDQFRLASRSVVEDAGLSGGILHTLPGIAFPDGRHSDDNAELIGIHDGFSTGLLNGRHGVGPDTPQVIGDEIYGGLAVFSKHLSGPDKELGFNQIRGDVFALEEKELEPADGVTISWYLKPPHCFTILVEQFSGDFSLFAAGTRPSGDQVDFVALQVVHSCPCDTREAGRNGKVNTRACRDKTNYRQLEKTLKDSRCPKINPDDEDLILILRLAEPGPAKKVHQRIRGHTHAVLLSRICNRKEKGKEIILTV